MRIPNNEPWVLDAACSGTDGDAFFPALGESARPAKRVCIGCPVRTACLRYALEHNMSIGVWGGMSARERARIRRGEIPADMEPIVPPDPSEFGRRCVHCGTRFLKKQHSPAKYCSDECRVQVRRKRQRDSNRIKGIA